MTTHIQHIYQPTYGIAPGKLLQEFLEERGISARELGRRCGRSAKLIVEIIAGKAPIEPETALQFEHVLGMQADVWLNMEAAYRLHMAKEEETRRLSNDIKWASRFPLADLERRKLFKKSNDQADTVRQLLQFFGVGSVEACRERFSELAAVSYRHSPSFKSNEEPLLVWLRVGEIHAEGIECAEYDRSQFLVTLREIRKLTRKPIETFLPEIKRKCSATGVVFVAVKPFDGTALSGVSRWLNPRKAIIQQSVRHMSNDHFWFTFFHEAAHLLLHSRKNIFIDSKGYGSGDAKEEREANEWAANFLIPQNDLDRFIGVGHFSAGDVTAFAEEQGIAPGIVVGQLQKRGAVPYSRLNKLKDRYMWAH